MSPLQFFAALRGRSEAVSGNNLTVRKNHHDVWSYPVAEYLTWWNEHLFPKFLAERLLIMSRTVQQGFPALGGG